MNHEAHNTLLYMRTQIKVFAVNEFPYERVQDLERHRKQQRRRMFPYLSTTEIVPIHTRQ